MSETLKQELWSQLFSYIFWEYKFQLIYICFQYSLFGRFKCSFRGYNLTTISNTNLYLQLPDLQLEPARSSSTRQKSTSGRLSSRSNRSSRTRKSSSRTKDKSSAFEREAEEGIKVSIKSPEPGVRFPESGVKFPERFAMPNNSNQEHFCLPDYMETPILYPNVASDRAADYNDLTCLPPPKKILPRKDAPWVYRFKVKRNMNALSRIMASKPNQMVAQSGQGT